MIKTAKLSHPVLLVISLFLMSNSYSQIDTNPKGSNSYLPPLDTVQLYPVINSVPIIKAAVGSLYEYKVHASGWHNKMVYSLLSYPAGMTIDSTSGLISWTPDSLLADGLVSVVAANGLPPADTQTFRINIAEAPVYPDGLFVLLKLDESSGPEYSDYYGIHNVSAVYAPVAVDGIMNGAQLFDSTTLMDIQDISTEFDFPAHASFSYEYWIRTSSPTTMVCLGRHRLDTEKTAFMYVGTDKNGKAAFELRDNGGTLMLTTGTTVIADGEWHHFIAVRDAEANLDKIFVDGIEEASDSVTFDSSFAAVVPTEINIGYLHRLTADEPHYYFTGSLDEISIYNRALTASDAAAFYNNGHPHGHCEPGNYAPVITSIPPTVVENETYSYTFITDDIDSTDLLILSASEKPSWLSFTWVPGQKTATLAGIPSGTDAGVYPVKLSVTDGYVRRDQSFVISVQEGQNDIPVITYSPDPSAFVDALYTYLFAATDADDSVLTKSALLLPAWMQFDPETGILAGIPLEENMGENEVILRVSDGSDYVDLDFVVTVVAPFDGVNDLETAGIHFYPVPAKNYLNFSFARPFEKMQIEVINSSGKIVAIKELHAYTEKYLLDVTGLGNGTYFLKINTGGKTLSASFMIIK